MFRTPAILPWLFPSLTWRINTNQKELFLTFDDGPIPGPTEFVLETLKQFQAKATFFCIGDNIRKHPEIFKQIIKDGHRVGNHTYHHMKGWGTSTEKYINDVKMCGDQIASHVGYTNSTKLFRPPYGRISGKQVDQLKSEYQIIMWDVLTSDYSQSMKPDTCLMGSIKATRPGSIIVFHDSLKAKKNMKYVLPNYLNHFSELGYTFELLTPNS
jgi:peptidoglycan/xylan/chitin deacetylase (PgdA/CDA1 family)